MLKNKKISDLKTNNLTGLKIGKLTVIGISEIRNKHNRIMWDNSIHIKIINIFRINIFYNIFHIKFTTNQINVNSHVFNRRSYSRTISI